MWASFIWSVSSSKTMRAKSRRSPTGVEIDERNRRLVGVDLLQRDRYLVRSPHLYAIRAHLSTQCPDTQRPDILVSCHPPCPAMPAMPRGGALSTGCSG
jgi:hypothetical protein